jgi:hypothetical protein
LQLGNTFFHKALGIEKMLIPCQVDLILCSRDTKHASLLTVAFGIIITTAVALLGLKGTSIFGKKK